MSMTSNRELLKSTVVGLSVQHYMYSTQQLTVAKSGNQCKDDIECIESHQQKTRWRCAVYHCKKIISTTKERCKTLAVHKCVNIILLIPHSLGTYFLFIVTIKGRLETHELNYTGY